MIILDLKEIFERFDVFEDRYLIPPEELSFPADVGEVRSPVEVSVRIEKDRDGYKVDLKIRGSVELECSRCLEPFDKELYEDRTKHVERYPREEHLSLSPEDLEVSFLEEPDILVLEDIVREEILLSVPMKPLCKLDCPGVHHNSVIFEEEKESHGDPRFAILKDLLTE